MTDFSPTHPGVVLRQDFLKPMGLSQYALAKAIGVPQIRVSEIVNAKRAITPDSALRLLFGKILSLIDDLRQRPAPA